MSVSILSVLIYWCFLFFFGVILLIILMPLCWNDSFYLFILQLTRLINELFVFRKDAYSSLLEPATGLCFTDQFAFRPSGSTAAAIISLLHTVLTMLSTNDHVQVIALDFSKAFDTIRHATLMEKWPTYRCWTTSTTGLRTFSMDTAIARNMLGVNQSRQIFRQVSFKDLLSVRHLRW